MTIKHTGACIALITIQEIFPARLADLGQTLIKQEVAR
jgi:hypothetical protein